MKKLLLILLFVPFFGFGQSWNHQIGIVIGESLNILESPDENIDYSITTISALGIKYYVSEKFSINSKILFHPKGYKVNDLLYPPGSTALVRDNHISLPILLQYHLGKKNNYLLNVGWFTSFKGKRGVKINNDSFVWSDPTWDIDGGIVLGLSYIYPINYKINLNFEVESHYAMNLANNIQLIKGSINSYIVQVGLNYSLTR